MEMEESSAGLGTMGYVFHELCMWHNAGTLQGIDRFIEPTKPWENVDTKRRINSLLLACGMLEKPQIVHIKARSATVDELARVHDWEYIEKVQVLSQDPTNGQHTCGDEASFSPGGFKLACLAAGGTLEALKAIMQGRVQSSYVLCRPPGHHAERAEGAGYCIFNNVAVAAAEARAVYGLERICVVDYDVHHGNGTQHIFEEDKHILFISVHQDSNYPLHSGAANEQGVGEGTGFTINCPLPPGSGTGAYKAAFERVVLPAMEAFRPQLVLVSSGFDASYADPLSAQILSSQDFRWMATQLKAVADRHCGGKLLAVHEGGYSEVYTPFCCLAVVEALSGVCSGVIDPFLHEVSNWGYQRLQVHQDAAISAAEPAVKLLKGRMQATAN